MTLGQRGKFVYDSKTKKFKRYKTPKKNSCHGVITDEIEPMESYATPHREIFTSKSKYRKHLRALGFRETGGDHLHTPRESDIRKEQEKEDRDRREDLEKAYMDVKYDRVQFTEQEKENHRREERRCRQNNLPTKLKNPY